jgi:hypothetical protein
MQIMKISKTGLGVIGILVIIFWWILEIERLILGLTGKLSKRRKEARSTERIRV